MKKRCPRIKRLHAFVSGDAEEPEQNRIEQHLHTCFLCRELVETIESEKDPIVKMIRTVTGYYSRRKFFNNTKYDRAIQASLAICRDESDDRVKDT